MPASDALNLDHFTLATWVNPAASANADALYPLIAANAGDERNYALYLTEELTGGCHTQLRSRRATASNEQGAHTT
ncbi:MAG: hypothetical protein R2867_26660 [Caldilineaceae bacterium]